MTIEIRTFSPKSLKEGRLARGLNTEDLATAIGVTRQAISLFEQGFNKPSPETLSKIASELNLPAKFFMNERKHKFNRATTFYRKLRSAESKTLDQAQVKSEWACDTFSYLSRSVKTPEPNLPELFPGKTFRDLDDDDIEDAALSLRKNWGLGLGPISNLTILFEKFGVVINHFDFPEEINAFSFWTREGIPFICCSSNVTAVRNRFNLGHEIAHLLLHKGVEQEEIFDKDIYLKIEKQADRFSGAFLFPSTSFCDEFYSTNLNHLTQLKSRWQMAITAIMFRACDLGILEQKDQAYVYKRLGGRKKKEPLDDVLKIEQPTLFSKALKFMLENRMATIEELKQELHYSDSDLMMIFSERKFFLEKQSENIIEFKPRLAAG